MRINILVSGTRDHNSVMTVIKAINDCFNNAQYNGALGDNNHYHIIHGGANGIDTAAGKVADLIPNATVQVFPANWKKYGRSAGYKRNEEMLNFLKRTHGIKYVVCVPGPNSKGTLHMIETAQRAANTGQINYCHVSDDLLIKV